MKDNMKSSKGLGVHADTKGAGLKRNIGKGIKGMTSVDKGAVREGTAPTPASMGPRSA